MPSPYSTERSELCRHDTSRVGCISCKQHGVRGRLTESEFKLAQIRDRLRALPNSILWASTEQVRQYLVEEEEEAKAKQDLSEIRKVVDSVANEVRAICAKTEPHMLAKAFEEDAAARELKMNDTLRKEPPKRVKAKANVDKAKTSDSSRKEESSTGGWPDIEGHDWAGLTNWTHRCMKTDKKFFEVTLPSWKKQREDQRATMIDQLSKWNLSDAVAAGFDDGSSKHDDPRKHWPFSKSLAEIEAEEASEHH